MKKGNTERKVMTMYETKLTNEQGKMRKFGK